MTPHLTIAVAIFFAIAAVATIATNLIIIKLLRRIKMNTDDLIAKFDAATTAAASRVTALIASIKASGQTLTAAQEAEATALTAHLDKLGSDPANPVPAPPAVPAP